MSGPEGQNMDQALSFNSALRPTVPAAIDLEAYFLRIGYSGDRPPTLDAELLTYYDFPREHWKSLRTSNPIESTFDPVRLRTRATRRMRKAQTGLYLVFQLIRRAERRWRRIDAPHLVAKVLEGVQFVNGVEVIESAKKRRGVA